MANSLYFMQRLYLNTRITTKAIVSLLLIFSMPLLSSAQEVDSMGDPGDNPEWQIKMGKEAFSVENYPEAIDHFNTAIGLYGQTNLEIQYYLVKAYYGLHKLDETQSELQLFFNLGPDSNYIYLPEMRKLKDAVEIDIKSEEEDYQRAKNSTTIILLDAYLSKHPYGKHRDEINKKKLTLAEDKAYQRAKNINDISLYQQFVRDYPTSKYRAEAEAAIERLDKINFDKAIAANTDISLRTYINNAADSARKEEATAKLNLLLETGIYDQAIKDNTVPAFKNYLSLYPETEHAKEIKRLLAERILKLAREAEKESKYDVAVDYYNDYLTTFPLAEDKADVVSKKAKAERKAKLDEIPRRAYMTYAAGLDASAPSNIGIRFGSLRSRSSGGFLLLRFNTSLQLAPEYDHTDSLNDGSLRQNNNYSFTGNKRVGKFEFLFGFNRAITKHLWMYAGFGFGYKQVLYEVEVIKGNDPAVKTWSVHSKESTPGYIWELGLTANVFKYVTLNAGLASFNSKTYYPTVGIGFSWVAKDQTK